MDITNKKSEQFKCYELGNSYKFEQWGTVKVARPEPQATQHLSNFDELIKDVDIYYDDVAGKGEWVYNRDIKTPWTLEYNDLKFELSPSSFKQLGLFPEQATNWDFVAKKIKQSNRSDIKVLNLFAYTGAATISAAKAGAQEVVHVDALKSANEWAKRNSELSHTTDCTIRYFQDDIIKFLKREIKRGHKYNVIIMDPPSFGRGPKGEVWKFQENLSELLKLTKQLLEDPLCVVISTYTTGFSGKQLLDQLSRYYDRDLINTGRLFLPVSDNKILQCGIFGRIDFK